MLGVNRSEHIFLAQEFVDVLFGLGIEARIMIGIPCVGRSATGRGRGAHDRFVVAAEAAGAGVEAPDVVATFRISVPPSDETGSANFLRREQWVQAEQPVAAGLDEVGIGRY